MTDSPTLPLSSLKEKIPNATLDEIKIIMDCLGIEKELYSRADFIDANCLISKKLIEISKTLRK
jgi:hypothetical protein